MNSCRNCKFAEWPLTKNGRRHPSKVGECKWEKTIHVPFSNSVTPIVLRGGYIWPKNPKLKCPTFQEIG